MLFCRGVMPAAATMSADVLDARAAQVRAAVEALAVAISKIGTADCGKAFVDAVIKWKGKLVRGAPTLVALDQNVRKARSRLPASPPALREAADAFVKAIDTTRSLSSEAAPAVRPAPVTPAMTLSEQVQPPNLTALRLICAPRARRAPGPAHGHTHLPPACCILSGSSLLLRCRRVRVPMARCVCAYTRASV